jgi:hypothetical protein
MAKLWLILRLLLLAAFGLGLATSVQAKPRTIAFSGYSWTVRADGKGGPGPNHWKSANVWLDENGSLHLKLTHQGGRWYCAELETTEPLGFGTYQFWLDTRIDDFDPNIVLGLFNYTTPDIGPDGTNEIDIEFARWGNPKWPNGNYTVFPAKVGKPDTTHGFEITDTSSQSTHRFTWSSKAVKFQSLSGHQNGSAGKYAAWTFAPDNPKALVPQHPIPVHINLWLAKGNAPIDGQEVEVVVRAFSFTPLKP